MTLKTIYAVRQEEDVIAAYENKQDALDYIDFITEQDAACEVIEIPYYYGA
jgi:hypothetical protein